MKNEANRIYVVQGRDHLGRGEDFYCFSPEEADEVATNFGNAYPFVEILSGCGDKWESISRAGERRPS